MTCHGQPEKVQGRDAGAGTAAGSWARVPRRGKCGGIGRVPGVPASSGKRVRSDRSWGGWVWQSQTLALPLTGSVALTFSLLALSNLSLQFGEGGGSLK